MVIYPCVAGKFYPENPETLRKNILEMLKGVEDKKGLPIPKAIVAPHAGYIYSGPIAASAYACLSKAKKQITRVVILAPAHQYPLEGIATTSAEGYLTPLGQINIGQEIIASLNLPYINIVDEAFHLEHSLEVQLPFLQSVLENFSLVPFLVGQVIPHQIEKLLEEIWDGANTLIVISSDLSHYYPYKTAQTMDHKISQAIIDLDPEGFAYDNACGAVSIKGLLMIAPKKNLHAHTIDLRNSGDTAGSKDSVVGYGAFHFSSQKDN